MGDTGKFLPDLAGKTEQQESPDIEKETALQEHFPYLNTKFGMSICMNDEAFYLKMLKVYIEDEMSDILQRIIRRRTGCSMKFMSME